MKQTDKKYACRLKDHGFYAANQGGKSLYVKFTDNIKEARLYKTRKNAARSLNYKNVDHPNLEYFEVVIECRVVGQQP